MALRYWLLLILAAIIALIFAYRAIKRKIRGTKLHGLDKPAIKKKWEEIEGVMKMNNEMAFKMAVMEADKLLDHTLKYMFFAGSTMGERLKLACYKYPELRQVWWAHKIRNKMAHEANYNINYKNARSAMASFKKAFKDLGIF